MALKGTEGERVNLVALDRAKRKASLEMIVPGRVRVSNASTGPADGAGQIRPAPNLSLGAYHALVIGNNEYKGFKRLKTAINDAEVVAGILRDRYGFKVKLLRNATRGQILSELNELRQRLTDKDNLLIYYAGHGEMDQKNQRGYWLPVDAEPGNTANWISNIDLSDVLNLMAVKHLLVVADSCYAATLTRSAAGRLEATMTEEELARAVQNLANKRARLVLTSGGVEPVLDNTGGDHSVFAQIFIDTLKANDGVLLGRDVFQRVQLRVNAIAQRWAVPQVPEYAPIKYAGHEGGDFFFLRTGTLPANDDMVVDAHVEQLGAVDELPGEPQVLPAGRRIAAGMVVEQDQGGGRLEDGRLETSRGCTRLAESVPSETTTSRSRPFWASSKATRKTSFLRSSISGP